MISLRYVSKYHKFCIGDSTEGELFFDVKKLMTRGDLKPLRFGDRVSEGVKMVNLISNLGNMRTKL